MKKLTCVILIFTIFLFTSCGGGDTGRSVVRDDPSSLIIEALDLKSVQEGQSLNTSIDKNKEYVDVKISEDPKNSLFYQTIDMDAYLTEHFKEIYLRVLYFNGQIPTDDANSFVNEMNNTTYGLNSSKIGYDFQVKENVSEVLFEKLSLSYRLDLPEGYEKKDEEAKLVIVYLPTYCTYNDGAQDYTKVFLMVPVFYAFTYESEVKDYTKNIKNYQVVLEDGLLPNNSTKE